MGRHKPKKSAAQSKPASNPRLKVHATAPGERPANAPVERPPRAECPRPRATAESMAKLQKEISVSEFFAKNRHLLGFDNKRKALLMCVKEAVDNALDACEEAGHLPEIEITLVQVAEDRFRVAVRDNGPGIVMQQVPNVFGKLLYGSKFHRLKMSRGQQGIGISAAGMYGLLTTGKSIKVISRTSPRKQAYYCEIQIDTRKNAPNIVKQETINVDWPSGTQVEIELVGSYNKGRQSVDEYVEQTAIANPHARFVYNPPAGERAVYERGTGVAPAHTTEIKPHPYGVELGMLIKMLHETKSHWLSGFLQSEFCRVGPKVAEEICKNARLNPRAHPKRIARQEAEKLYEAIQKTRLMAPPTNCLAPIGAEQILTGMLKGVKAEFFTASTRPPAVYRGNPFQIEVGLAYGGELGPDPRDDNGEQAPENEAKVSRGKIVNGNVRNAPQARIIRFANRVPLLYQQSACGMFKSVIDLDWRRYGLSQSSGALPQAPLIVLVHMASVWVPFTSESKEAIADYDEIRQEIRLAMQDCGRKLSAYLNRRRKQKYEGDRRDVFERYIKEIVEACDTIKRINRKALTDDLLVVARKITHRADEQLDEHGKAVRKCQAESEFGPNTVVVDRGEEAAGPLFHRAG
ncbi:MAG TPA: DNA topoisomerase VI subunit B [Phycisphaerae bacterium]|nr:DNA topoisomerase VI subunit B [Phycisphaerae bacterium]